MRQGSPTWLLLAAQTFPIHRSLQGTANQGSPFPSIQHTPALTGTLHSHSTAQNTLELPNSAPLPGGSPFVLSESHMTPLP